MPAQANLAEGGRLPSKERSPVIQEFRIGEDGAIQVPWLSPGASELILELWKELRPDEPFPVRVLCGRIYCG